MADLTQSCSPLAIEAFGSTSEFIGSPGRLELPDRRKARLAISLFAALSLPLGWLQFALAPVAWPQFYWPLGSFGFRPLSSTELLLVLLLGVATYTDLRWRRIFNWTNYPILVWGGILASLVSTHQLAQIDSHYLGRLTVTGYLAGTIGCGLVMLVPYQLARGGAGDIKLSMVLGGLLGFVPALWALAVGYILAASWVVFRSIIHRDCWELPVALLRQYGHVCWPHYITPPTMIQKQSLLRPVPLAGFFGLGVLMTQLMGIHN